MKKLAIIVPLIIILIIAGVAVSNWWQRYLHPLKNTELISANARRNHVDPYLIAAIIYEESRFRQDSRSRAGAVGLMQIMPDTALWISQKTRQPYDGASLSRPENNIAMGAWYFSWLRQKYGSENLALAAYNSGDQNMDRWLRDRGRLSEDGVISSIPYPETREFVRKVQLSREVYRRLYPEAFKGT